MQELNNQVRVLQAVVSVFVDMFEDEVELYWLSTKFALLQKQFQNQWGTLVCEMK